jgi:4-carboxymuconolactone decarboxylase
MTDSVKEKRARGRALVKNMLGEEYYNARDASKTEFNADSRELAEEYCFGDIWVRPGLDRKTRSMLCLAVLTALGRQPELKLHVVGALRSGWKPDEIKEALLQMIIYCGLPLGNAALKSAEEVLKEQGVLGKK